MSLFGHFKDDKEYVFTTPETPRPALNYLWNDRILAGVNQTGGGNGSYGGRAMTYIDPDDLGRCSVIQDGNRYFYIRDMETGKVFNPGWYPSKTPLQAYRCTHGLGYTVIESSCDGLDVRLRGFAGSEPCEIWTLKLANHSDKKRVVRTFSFAEFQLEGYDRYSDYMSYVYGEYFANEHLVFCHNDAMEKPHDWFNGFLASDRQPTGFDTSRNAFLGVYGDIRGPKAIEEGACTGSLAACERMAGILEHTFTLEPGEETEFHTLIGSADTVKTAKQIAATLFEPGVIEKEYQHLLQSKAEMMGGIIVDTPDKKVDRFTNYWLKQQVQLCAEIGRDSCKGFRDQLQDAWAIASFQPRLAKAKILETLRYEYANGQCERGWLPVRFHIYSDGPAWIPLTVNAYIKETGDMDILAEEVPYYDTGSASVWDHMLVAVRNASDDTGEHGLVHALEGDWNDSLNMIGREGKGESVWTSIALCMALRDMAEMACELKGDETLAGEMERRAEKLAAAINETAWDGKWYLAAYNDDGNPVGSHAEQEGQVYLNPQTWAILAGIADEERLESCLETLDTLLDSDYGPLTLYPTYTKFNDRIGRLTSFVPGIWENGTPYCHGGTFKVVADCVCGRGNAAYETMLKIFPDSELNPSDYSGCEPYSLTNMYFGPDNPRKGQTLFSWVTGTAGWMFRAVTQYMLGFYPGYETVTISPCIPVAWKHCSMKRNFRGDTYHIAISNPNGVEKGNVSIVLDGKPIAGDCFAICGDGREHSVEVEIKAD